MAQVTMDGREYVELISKVKEAETANKVLIQALVIGDLTVNPDETYSKVHYKVAATLPEIEEMKPYMAIRVKDVTEKLEQNPLAVQLLFDGGNGYFNPITGYFTSYSWDDNVAIKDMSKILDKQWEKLEDGERLVDEEEEQ